MANEIDIEHYTSDELSISKLVNLIDGRKTFKIGEIKDISTVVKKVEVEIEKRKLRCRVYTEYRSAAIAGAVIPLGVTQVTGVASAIGIGFHNLFTFNPDYEIAKNSVNGTVTVFYKKG